MGSKVIQMPNNFKDLKWYSQFFRKCSKCGTCKSAYSYGPPPTNATICPQGEYFKLDSYYGSRSKSFHGHAILENKVDLTDPAIQEDMQKVIFSCTVCGGCQSQCLLDYKPWICDYIEEMRHHLVNRGIGPTKAEKIYQEKVIKDHNPYGETHSSRFNWLKDVKDLKTDGNMVYFAGCTASYRRTEIAKSTASVLSKLGEDWGVMGENEYCCGSPLLRAGLREEPEKLAQHNVDYINDHGFKTVVTACAGCYKVLSKEYEKWWGLKLKAKVMHTSEYLEEKMKKGELKLNNVPATVTYHDPCHMGRHMNHYEVDMEGKKQWKGSFVQIDKPGLYETPRNVLKAIPGIQFKEMYRNRDNSFCCGAGGGIKSSFPDVALETAKTRVREAEGVEGVQKIVTPCPFCVTNLGDGAKALGSKMEVVDLIQLVDQALKK